MTSLTHHDDFTDSAAVFSSVLLAWYETHKRDLPWRNTRDPYLIWLSEVILQQTRVEQGYDYFLRFARRYPTVQHLAAAPIDEVMKLWQGLGYYSRAANLHRAACSIKGAFPATYKEVRTLRGVGDYTAAAICSIAYNMPYAVVDGNVYRVLSRYFGISLPIDGTEGKKYFATLAQALLPQGCAGIYNQAIMDFGALQCVPHNPRCGECPLAESCVAHGRGEQQLFPVKSRRISRRERHFHYLCIQADAGVPLRRREGRDIWKGLYEFPLVETEVPLSAAQFAHHPAVRQMLGEGVVPVPVPALSDLKHVLTHQTIYATFYLAATAEPVLPAEFAYFAADEVAQLPVSRLMHRFVERYPHVGAE